MNKRELLSSGFILLFILVFSWFTGHDFFDFSKQNQSYRSDVVENTGKLESFSLENISEISDAEFYYTPDTDLLDTITDYIDNAKTRVYVEVYMLTESRIKESLVRAYKRGIDVRVVLEKNPYLAYNINNKHFSFLEDTGINMRWSNPKNYSLNHAKFMLIDDRALVSTGNFTYSTFTKNRDLFITTRQPDIVAELEQIFAADFVGEQVSVYHDNMVISPTDSREKFRVLFEGATQSLLLYFQYISDDSLRDILIEKVREGVEIKLIVSETSYEEDAEELDILRDAGVEIGYLDKQKMHSKAILVDEAYLFVGSVNFSYYSFDKNREVGLVFKNEKVIQKFIGLFEKDFY